MAEETTTESPEQPVKKKGGKLPIIIALVLVLAGGGFFVMKGKGSQEPPPVKLGAVEPLAEFLVNLREPNAYLRAEIALHFQEGYEKEQFDKNLPAVRDAIVLTLGSLSIQQVRTLDGKLKLKKDLVEAINKVLEASEAEAHPGPKQEPASEDKKRAARGTEGKKGDAKPAKDAKPKTPEHPDWDSQTGPVLKLYFTSFATQ